MNKIWTKSLALSCTATMFAAVLSAAAASGTNNLNGYNKVAEETQCIQVQGQAYICCDSSGCFDATYT